MSKDSFIIHDSTILQASILTDEELGRLFRYQIAYHSNGIMPSVEDRLVYAIFSEWKRRYDDDKVKYERRCETNRKNGSKSSGAPKGNKYASKHKDEVSGKEEVTDENNPLEANQSENNPKQPKTTQNNPMGCKNNPKLPDSDSDCDSDCDSDPTHVGIGDSSLHSESSPSDDDVVVEEDLVLTHETNLQKGTKMDYGKIKELFNSTIQKYGSIITQIQSISGSRIGSINARVREHGKASLAIVFENAAKSNFLNGSSTSGFTANFDWLMRPNNYRKVLEGNYNNKSNNTVVCHTRQMAQVMIANQCKTNEDWLQPGEKFEKPVPVSQMLSEMEKSNN